MGIPGQVLTASQSPLDLIDPQEGIDLSECVGDTDAALPFVGLGLGLGLATMATAESGTACMAVPLRRQDRATFMLAPQRRRSPRQDAFDVELMPRLSDGQDIPREALQPAHGENEAWDGSRRLPKGRRRA